ncbi:DNA alkylation repair protein [Myxococcus sp. K38C18041901]|uniref:DNA alkylation repair protein n=1 Tax=Myxococcus guangdongensis TaxID=2906760 RepID=UPI0020A750B4|nr:DNA alkylation repair protein [Myxococcus guangdongensis]MCP3063162.1 DNA alkylation repair protein [Myxococcus guangdongensis]
MAEPLKTFFDARLVERLGTSLHRVHPSFPLDTFLREARAGLEAHELVGRARHLCLAMRRSLPEDYPKAVQVLLRSLGPVREVDRVGGMEVFFYLPHTTFVAEYGLGHFEESMKAQHALTQRFTAEFSIRPFLEKHPEKTLARLAEWASDSNVHVRRLVSEGTRPRLPWGSRLRAFQQDPTPVLGLLELLKDDPELYVRRSVANNLNDIGKDHPDVLVKVAKKWMKDATPEREWLVRHALRFAIKRGEPSALEVVGAGKPSGIEVRATQLPKRAKLGGAMDVRFVVANRSRKEQSLVVDLAVHFFKSRGEAPQPKVFKVRELVLGAGQEEEVGKRVSLAQLSTRRHYAGPHRMDVRVNGVDLPLGTVDVVE